MYVCMCVCMNEDKNQGEAESTARKIGFGGQMNQDSRGPFSGQPPKTR